MTRKTKSIIVAVAGAIGAAVIVFCVYINTGPHIPGCDKTVKKVMKSKLPELVTGQTGFAHNGKVKIWFESFKPAGSPRGTILLIMGYAATSLRWQDFHVPFVNAGYQVVRFDNRCVGLSDWIQDWDKNNPFTLEDMALDALAVMDALKIDRAHIIGVSMGGMIAQQMAIKHTDRVASLTSIMSAGNAMDPELKVFPPEIMKSLIKISLRYRLIPTEINLIKYQVYLFYLISNDSQYDVEKSALIARYEVEKHGGYNPRVEKQQEAAIRASGSRYEQLGSIRVPALVIHGKSDPLVPVEHAYKYAPMIPHAKTLFIDGMGHDIPRAHMDRIFQAINQNMELAGAR